MVLGLVLLLVFAFCTFAVDSVHIAGESVTYLDGDSWTASSFIVTPDDCTFEQGKDFDEPGPGYFAEASASSTEDCCKFCKNTPGCAAGVWNSNVNQCFLKEFGAVEKDSSSNNWACNVQVRPFSIPATVPGEVISDLQRAGLISDPYFDINFLNSSIWANNWNISRSFTVPDFEDDNQEVYLVFEGAKMGAMVFVDEVYLGTLEDQFLRYKFPLSGVLRKSQGAPNLQHQLRVYFSNAVSVHNRFMACTGGWDWAPYTNTFQEGVPTFSRGLWQSVYLVTVTSQAPAITHVKALTAYLGPYPNMPLQDGQHGGFNVTVTVYLTSPFALTGTLLVNGSWGAWSCLDIAFDPSTESQPELEVTTTLTAHASDIELWWPNGMGSHTLYTVNVSYAPAAKVAQHVFEQDNTAAAALQPRAVVASASCQARHARSIQMASATVETSRRIGFRFIALVTGNDTDAEYVKRASKEEGTDTMGMFFRVNGAALVAKGANMIPMEELEGRLRDANHVILVQSAAAAHMNMLRVWGGGMYLPDAWYDACDDNGVLVYHDMQYATGGPHDNGGGPQYLETQYLEMQHQLRRLSHHASIAMWDGCNECDGLGLYEAFVMSVVAVEDTSRPVWPSCPSNGWASGVHKLTQLPNGKRLFHTDTSAWFEGHGPYFHGSGFPAVNGAINGADKGFDPVPFDPMMPLSYPSYRQPIGPMYQNGFTSEFGSSGFSSFESLSGTLSPDHWGVHGGMAPDSCTLGFQSTCTGSNPMSQRNYPCDGLVLTFFTSQTFNGTGVFAFQQQLYMCMLSQGLILKQQIEQLRADNTFGTLLWQLGEVWPTGGWGSLEYGCDWGSQGQVPGGRWKIFHHMLAATIYTDVTLSCGQGGTCYVRNDLRVPFSGTLSITAVNVTTGVTSPVYSQQLSLAAGGGSLQWFELPSSLPDATGALLEGVITDSNMQTVTTNLIHMLPPYRVAFAHTTLTFSVATSPNTDRSVNVTLQAYPAPAFYATLTTLAAGRFSDNALLVLPSETHHLRFIPFGDLDLQLLLSSTRAEHLAMYL